MLADVTDDRGILDEDLALAGRDPGGMLAAVASAGAQVRAGLTARIPELGGPPPRALVVVGMGGSAAAGDVLAVVAGASSVPVLVHRGAELPGWIGPDDLVVGLSCSGGTEETLDAVADALARGSRLVTIGAAASPLNKLSHDAGAPHVDVDAEGRQPRASLWALATPLVLVAAAAGVAASGRDALAVAATLLDGVAAVSRADIESGANPAKQLALHLSGGLPLLWGAPGLGAAVANRFGCQIAENAKLPAVVGALSEAHHNQIVAFDGPAAAGADPGGLRLVVLADDAEPARMELRVAESLRAAQDAGVPAVCLRGSGPDRLARLAGLVALIDFASVYLALLTDVDPTPVAPIDALKTRMSAPTEGER